jgi:N-acetylneuraminic acid mutarotase
MEALKVFWRLDLSRPAAERSWEELTAWPGFARILPATAAQDGAFFLASGARLFVGEKGQVRREYLADAYRYDAAKGWQTIASPPFAVVAAAAAPVGNSHVLFLSGDDGANAERIQELRENHPGFRGGMSQFP